MADEGQVDLPATKHRELKTGNVHSPGHHQEMGCMRAQSFQLSPTLCNPMDFVARQATLSMGFPRQENWSRLPFPPPGDLPN